MIDRLLFEGLNDNGASVDCIIVLGSMKAAKSPLLTQLIIFKASAFALPIPSGVFIQLSRLVVVSSAAQALQPLQHLRHAGAEGPVEVGHLPHMGDLLAVGFQPLRREAEVLQHVVPPDGDGLQLHIAGVPEDTVSRDIIGSKRAGFAKAIQICSQLTREKDCGVKREFEPDYMVEDIYEVLPILRELTGK